MSVKISDLPTLSSLTGNEKIPVGNNSDTASAVTTALLKQYCATTPPTIPVATPTSNGLMPSTDKAKLNNIQISGIKVVTSEVSASDNILYIVVPS